MPNGPFKPASLDGVSWLWKNCFERLNKSNVCCYLCISMAVVIRLQGLRTTAGSEDIRNFFTGLKIPDGGVHIIGGPLEEAFIIFASDDHARRAMTRSGGCIRGSPVHLLLSSKAEMQHVLEASAKRTEMSRNRVYNEGFRRAETNMGPPIFAENLVVEVRRTDHLEMDGITGPEDMRVHQTRKTLASGNDGFYLHLQGLPFSISREDVRVFFKGLLVDDIILMKNRRGQNNGMGIVRFGTLHDAYEGLKRDREYIGTRFIEINSCSEKQWVEAGGSVGPHTGNAAEFHRESPPSYVEKRYPQQRTRSVSPVRYRSRSSSPSENEYCVLMENLSYSVDKRGIKSFFHPVELKEDQILHLHDKYGKRTRAAFVLFRSLKDYCVGLTRHKEALASRTIYVSPISKEKMVAMLDSPEQKMEKSREKPSTSLDRPQRSQRPKYESERVCIYVRNLPFDVRKVEIMDFFQGYRLSEDMVHLLRDEKGAGLGEALVTFHSEEEAQRAESLHGQMFLGSEVMLKCISRMQMQEFGVTEHPRKSAEHPLRMRSPEGYSTRHREASNFPLGEEYPDIGIPSDVHMPLRNLPVRSHGSSSRFNSRKDGRDTFVDREGGSAQRGLGNQFDGPACLKLINLPLNITIDEIYDFCYGYRVIPGSVSLQYHKNGTPKGCATVVFESRQEAQTAIQELSGRPIGTKKIKLLFL
ncbi:RNA-binding protein 12B-like isoform X3 [Anguilla rostrata]|uniref:RNA-binding protein 12B-like isoform X3 n=1 Tax=Anguilla rostrata TaxID=7938 RepID=UPI0030D13F71